MLKINLLLMALALLISACAPPPPPAPEPATTVVLLPDEEGRVGVVDLTTSTGSRRIDVAYGAATTGGNALPPSEVEMLGEAAVRARYNDVLSAQPSKPQSFMLYFLLDKAVLTPASKASMPALFAAVEARKPTEISIFGHTDSLGADDFNLKLSAARAKAIENILRAQDPTLGEIEIKYFGDQEPLIPTGPNVPEPRNRRAEVIVL